MNTKLQLFCAISLCFAVEWNTALAADNSMGIQETTNSEVMSNRTNTTYNTVETRSTGSYNEISQEDLAIVKLLLGHQGLGYPKSHVISRRLLEMIYDAPQKHSRDELREARQLFLEDTNVEIPEHGKLYTIKFYDYEQHAFLLDYTDGKVSTHEVKAGQTPNKSAYFKAHVFDNGKVAFQTVDKKWLSYPTKTPAPDWLKGYALNGVTDNLNEATNGLDLRKAGKGENVKSGNVTNLFGKFYIKSKRGTDVNTNEEIQGYWVLNTSNNTFDAAGDPYYNENFSSVILIEPVKVTNGIQEIDTTAKRANENKIFTLSGQRMFVEKLSDLPRGIYIVNGKKVLVK